MNISSKSSSKKILIYAHYNPHDEVFSHVKYTLEKLRPFFKSIIFVSNSNIADGDIENVQKYTDKIKIRKNTGLFYGAWKDVIMDEGWESLTTFDSLTLMNDACFGPLFPLESAFSRQEKENVDLWSFSEEYDIEGNYMPKNHICFGKQAIISTIFQKFWDKIFPSNNSTLTETIRVYEQQLIKKLQSAGFSYSTYRNAEGSTNIHPGSSSFEYKFTDINGNPFIKISNFFNYTQNSLLIKQIEASSTYPINAIHEYFYRTYNPNESLKLLNKSVVVYDKKILESNNSVKIALHIHAYYIEIFEIFFQYIKNWQLNFDLFVTTDTQAKCNQIETIIQKTKKEKLLKKIIVYENRGRDIYPWLSLSEFIQDYDIVGHFHSKRTTIKTENIGTAWVQEIIESLIIPIDDIIDIFNENNDIGIIMPDIPNRLKFEPEKNLWLKNKLNCEVLWEKMKTKKTINFKEIQTPIMPIGNMFWYKPNALKPLFDLKLSAIAFPLEPISEDGTIAHAIERLPIYIAWSQGYDFRIAINKKNILSAFEINLRGEILEKLEKRDIQIKRLIRQLNIIQISFTWRIGAFFTYIPNKIFSFFQRKK